MPHHRRCVARAQALAATLVVAVSALGLIACGGGDAVPVVAGAGSGSGSGGSVSGGGSEIPRDPPDPAGSGPSSYILSIEVTGLDGKGLVLQNLGGDDLAIAANGRYSFPGRVMNGGSFEVSVRTQPKMLSQTCSLTDGSGTVAGSDVTVALNCVTPTARFAYVADMNGHSITGLRINAADGTFDSPGSTNALATDSVPLNLAATPDGHWLFAVDGLHLVGNGRAIDATTGVLSAVANPPTTDDFPVAAAVAPSGRFLYVINNGAGSVRVYGIDATTGALSDFQTLTGQGPGLQALAVDPSGKFLLVANSFDSTVKTYAIDAGSGILRSLNFSLDTAGGQAGAPESIVFDAGGRFVYVGNRCTATILALRFDATTGALTPVFDAAPLYVGAGDRCELSSLAVDPRGRFLYAAITGHAQITVLAIDPRTGAIAPVDGSPFQIDSPVYRFTIDPTGRFLYGLMDSASSGSDRAFVYPIDADTGAVGRHPIDTAITGMDPQSILLISR